MMTTKLLTKANRDRLLKNGRTRSDDAAPVVKLFTPDAQCTWLLSELDPENPDVAFGLCDLGMGSPELGYVCISEIESVRGQLGLPIERDRYFTPTQSLTAYAEDARQCGRIEA